MASYYHYSAHQNPTAAHAPAMPSAHHTVRGRGARLRQHVHQHAHKQFRTARKDEEAAALLNFRQRFELQRSFDLDDDLEFCPMLVSDNDMGSVHSSSGSDRASSASASPESSPQSHSITPESSFTLNSNSTPYVPASYQAHTSSLKLHQPAATRVRSAIPIVNPSTGLSMSSPPQSVSPSRMQAATQRW